MTVHVFLGPTLPLREARSILPDAAYHPPSAMGDIYRAARGDCALIGLVDGVFSQVATVWHKEILFALERGIPVLGAASIGALRAAELAAFGMEGVGGIYAAFASGALEDDDEVALAHGPAELGFPVLSVPMVTARAALRCAMAEGKVGIDTGERLLARAKRIHFLDRTWLRIAECAAGASPTASRRLVRYLQEPRHDVKRRDAIELLRRIRAEQEGGIRPRAAGFALERTVFWERFEHLAAPGAVGGDCAGGSAIRDDTLRRHAMLTLGDGVGLLRNARLQACADRQAERDGRAPSAAALQAAVDGWRRERGLLAKADAEAWLAARGMQWRDLARIVRQDLLLAAAAVPGDAAVDAALRRELQRCGLLRDVADAARRKQRFLDRRGLHSPTLADCGLDGDGFAAWYGRRFRPLRPTLEDHAAALGFETAREFLSAALGQYLWERDAAGQERRGERQGE